MELSLSARGIRVERMACPTQLTDEELLQLSASGDENAFAELYERRQGGLFRFALHMSGREDVAEEVTQEVFFILIREPSRFDAARGAVRSFLYGMARNLVLRHLERSREFAAMEEECEPVSGMDVIADLSREQTVESVRQAVLSLPPVYREAVALCDLEEVSYAEAATALGVPVGTVRSRLNRGRSLLAEKLGSMLGCRA